LATGAGAAEFDGGFAGSVEVGPARDGQARPAGEAEVLSGLEFAVVAVPDLDAVEPGLDKLADDALELGGVAAAELHRVRQDGQSVGGVYRGDGLGGARRSFST
jgi:hypothetical protein